MAKKKHRPAFAAAREPDARERIIDLYRSYRDKDGRSRREQLELAAAWRRERFAAQDKALAALEEWLTLLFAAEPTLEKDREFDFELGMAATPPKDETERAERRAHFEHHLSAEQDESRSELAEFARAVSLLAEYRKPAPPQLTPRQRLIAEASEWLDPRGVSEVVNGATRAEDGLASVSVDMTTLRNLGVLAGVEHDQAVVRNRELVSTAPHVHDETCGCGDESLPAPAQSR